MAAGTAENPTHPQKCNVAYVGTPTVFLWMSLEHKRIWITRGSDGGEDLEMTLKPLHTDAILHFQL